jgi:PIN domain nuclease of toxin-antitoxin system
MLIARRKIEAGPSPQGFISDVIESRSVRVLPITPQIAMLAQSDRFSHGDPADRIIAATALAHRARLVSADQRLRKVKELSVVW